MGKTIRHMLPAILLIVVLLVAGIAVYSPSTFQQDNAAEENELGALVSTRDNQPPYLQNITYTRNPILNNGNQYTTLNFSVKDPNGWGEIPEGNYWDWEDAVVVDLRPVGGKEGVIGAFSFKNASLHEKYFIVTTNVSKATPPGIVELPVVLTDLATPEAGIAHITVNLTVEQYNRKPEPSENALDTLVVDEDSPQYKILDLKEWFFDRDEKDIITYDLGSAITDEFECDLFRATYYESTDSVVFNFKPEMSGEETMEIRTHDDHGHTYIHELTVKVNPVNDVPVIIDQGIGEIKNNSFILHQGHPFTLEVPTFDVDGDQVNLSIEWPEDPEPLFGIGRVDHTISYTPVNEDYGSHKAIIYANDGNGTDPDVSKVFWFNVTNTNDGPYFTKVAYVNINDTVETVYLNVTEHQWLNFTIEAGDPDIDLGLQDDVFFSSTFSLLGEKFSLDVHEDDQTKADVSFYAHGEGITCNVPEAGFGPMTGQISVSDTDDYLLFGNINISISVENVNDPPSPAYIDSPYEGETFMRMDVSFVAGIVDDPDEPYGDELTYVWDFYDEDGIEDIDAEGKKVEWVFEENGDYLVTLTVFDSYNVSTRAQSVIHIQGDPSGQDSDKDGLPDAWEFKWELDMYNATGDNGPDGDPDRDGLYNNQEYEHHTDPHRKDTDGDGYSDLEDFYPNDREKYKEVKPEAENNYACILYIIIAAVVFIVIVVIIIMLIIVRKKRQEEEEEEAKAEALAKEKDDQYKDQKLYEDTHTIQVPIEQPKPAPAPSEELSFSMPDLDDLEVEDTPDEEENEGPELEAPPQIDGPDVELPDEDNELVVKPPKALSAGQDGEQIKKLESILNSMGKQIKGLRSQDQDVSELEDLFAKAKETFDNGQFKEAKNLAVQIKNKLQ